MERQWKPLDCHRLRDNAKTSFDMDHQAPEQNARETINTLLTAAGWQLCDAGKANIHAVRDVVIREFPQRSGHGAASYPVFR